MKLSTGLGLLVAIVSTGGLTLAIGCGSSGAGANGGGDGGGGGSSGGGGNDICMNLPSGACTPEPTTPSGASPTTNKSTHNYALDKLYLGDTDRTGTPSTTAWQGFGYDLDGKITTAKSTDVCTLYAGAPKATQIDGPHGVDNSFGENIMPIVDTLDSTASQTLDMAIQGGSFTILTDVTGFDDSAGNSTTATGLNGVLLIGGKYTSVGDGGAPLWDMSTHWPIYPTEINGCTPSAGCPAGTDPVKSATIQFPSAFQTKGTFVNGNPATLTLSLSIGGQTLALDVASAVITFQPSMPGKVTGGIIAGVLNTEDLISKLQAVAGHISSSLCSGSAFMSIATQIQQTSDIILGSDGKVSNSSGTACNAISIGLGFDSTEIAQPTSADIMGPQDAGPSACADGG